MADISISQESHYLPILLLAGRGFGKGLKDTWRIITSQKMDLFTDWLKTQVSSLSPASQDQISSVYCVFSTMTIPLNEILQGV